MQKWEYAFDSNNEASYDNDGDNGKIVSPQSRNNLPNKTVSYEKVPVYRNRYGGPPCLHASFRRHPKLRPAQQIKSP